MKFPFRPVFHFLRNLFALIGVLTCLAGLYGVKLVMDRYQLTPHQFAIKLVQKTGVDAPWVIDLLRPPEKHPDYESVGKIDNTRRPRILYSGDATVNALQQRYRQDATYQKQVDALALTQNYLSKAVAWTVAGNRSAGGSAVRQLQGVSVQTVSAVGSYGNGLELALAYDLLSDLPDFDVADRQRIIIKLRQFLRDALTVLDGDSASLWHGRMQLSSSTWVAAVALGTENSTDRELVSRAQAHFHESLKSLELTEGWPEGYNYWINNRAYPFVLACLAHLNGVDAPDFNRRVQKLLERVGLWMIHGVEPQGRFHLFADTGPRNDLKDDTQRVIDLIYLATGNHVFREYSLYLTALHGRAAYYRGYRWALPLFRGFEDPPPTQGKASLVDLSSYLNKAEMFGQGSFNQMFTRSDWGDDATFVSFQAGDSFTHHGHYQAGHFTLNKAGEPLAISSGTYGGWTSPHRLNYYLRTVSANGLLVLKPNEKVAPNRFFDTNVAAGGQRITMPTGSAITSVSNWRENLGRGRHFEGGRVTAYEHQPDQYVYVAADLTAAYNNPVYDENGGPGKVEQVNRSLVYLPVEDVLLIYDRLTSTDPGYTKKWLLHTNWKPISAHEQVLVGDENNGILQTLDKEILVEGRKSRLTMFTLLPEKSLIRKVGGSDYRYYVEIDGDDTDLDGLNMDIGADDKPWFDSGMWRLEVQSKNEKKDVTFLVALYPRLKQDSPVPLPKLLQGTDYEGVIVDKTNVLFLLKGQDKNRLRYQLKETSVRQMIFGVAPERSYLLRVAEQQKELRSSDEGVLVFDLSGVPAGSEIEILGQ